MAKKPQEYGVRIIKASNPTPEPIKKSDKSEQLDAREELVAAEWLTSPFEMQGL